MQRIWITGTNGLLGQKLLNLLLSKGGYNIIASARLANRLPIKKGYEFYPIDIANLDDVSSFLTEHKPHYVINAAAMTQVDLCQQKQDLCYAINYEAVKNMSFICTQIKAQFIQVSTDFVFDGIKAPYGEGDKTNPLSVYGKSKAMAEHTILKQDPQAVIIRTSLLMGVTHDLSSNIVLWVKKSLMENKAIKMVVDQWRMPTLAEDLAAGILLIIEKKARGIYHLTGGDLWNMYALAKKIAEFWDLNPKLIEPITSKSLNLPAQRPPNTAFVLDKIKALGFIPRVFQDTLQKMSQQME